MILARAIFFLLCFSCVGHLFAADVFENRPATTFEEARGRMWALGREIGLQVHAINSMTLVQANEEIPKPVDPAVQMNLLQNQLKSAIRSLQALTAPESNLTEGFPLKISFLEMSTLCLGAATVAMCRNPGLLGMSPTGDGASILNFILLLGTGAAAVMSVTLRVGQERGSQGPLLEIPKEWLQVLSPFSSLRARIRYQRLYRSFYEGFMSVPENYSSIAGRSPPKEISALVVATLQPGECRSVLELISLKSIGQ